MTARKAIPMSEYHQPVLVDEVAFWLNPTPGGIYIDATLGGGGHSEMLLEKSSPKGIVLGVDRDSEALEYASQRLARFGERFTAVKGNFKDIPKLLVEYSGRVNGYLMDLGVSSHQLDSPRGFSFMRDEPLDMRMDTADDIPTAADVVNTYTKDELATILREYGEEKHWNRLSNAIVKARQLHPIRTTGELATIIRDDVGGFYRKEPIDPCTRSFMAIRLEVNQELDAIRYAIPGAVKMLAPGGRLVVISFHSLEDRIAKTEFRRLSGRCQCPPRAPECRCGAVSRVKILTSKPVSPGEAEAETNVRSRSSKLRCVEKL